MTALSGADPDGLASSTSADPKYPRGPVLVVDDERAVRMVIARALGRRGFEAFIADSGADALAQLGWRPVVVAVVSDVTMPIMSGLELARAVLERHPGLPILFVTASSVSDDLLSNPLVDCVTKPVRIAEMCERLDTLISMAADARRTPHHSG